MLAFYVLVVLMACAVAVTLYGGWRDGWLFGRTQPERAKPKFDYVAIAEIAKFQAVRRRIGYNAANAILRTLAGRIVAEQRCEIGRIGRTSIEFLYRTG